MNVNTVLIIAAVAAILMGIAACVTVVVVWPPNVPALIVMGPFCLLWGCGVLVFALKTRRIVGR